MGDHARVLSRSRVREYARFRSSTAGRVGRHGVEEDRELAWARGEWRVVD